MPSLNQLDNIIDFESLKEKYAPHSRHCKVCGAPLAVSKRSDAVTCTARCKQRLYVARRDARETIEHVRGLRKQLEAALPTALAIIERNKDIEQ